MNRQHYGAIIAVLVGYALCRVFSYSAVDTLGWLGGHARPGDSVVGAVFGAVPFLALAVYTGLMLRRIDVSDRRWSQVVFGIGWLLAGGVLGILPYSRFGTDTHLLQKERATSPGFLHALDLTIGVGLLLVVALLLVSLRGHTRHRPAG